MGNRIDEQARVAVARGRGRRRDATTLVDVSAVPARGGMRQLVAEWARSRDRKSRAAYRDEDEVRVQQGACDGDRNSADSRG